MSRLVLVPWQLPADAAAPLHAVPKQQLDAGLALKLTAASNLADLASAAAARANLSAAQALVPTATKTGAYTAVSGEFVKADAAGGAFTVTIPTAAAGLVVAVKKMDTSANAVTVTDGAGTTFNLRVVDEARILIGQASGWFSAYSLQTLTGLDTRYAQLTDSRFGDASALTTGTVAAARLPAVLSPVRPVNPSGGTISIDANGAGNSINSTLTSDATLNVPTNGADTQVLQGFALASGAQRVLTFAAGLGRLSPVGSTLTIPSGKIGRYALRRTDITGSARWLVESAGVEQ